MRQRRRPVHAQVRQRRRVQLGIPGSAFTAPIGRAWFNTRFKIFPLTLFTIDPNSAQHVPRSGRAERGQRRERDDKLRASFTADNTTERRFRGGISLENSSPDDPTASFVAATDRRRRGRLRETLEDVPGLEETGRARAPVRRRSRASFARAVCAQNAFHVRSRAG